jgi:cephalosporin-C deacetylase
MERDLPPTLTLPPDFERFWTKTRKELNAVQPELRWMPVIDEFRTSLELSRLTFRSLGGVEVTGYSIAWKDDAPRPLVVHSHGYGSLCDIQWAQPCPSSRAGATCSSGLARLRHVLRGAVCDYLRTMQIAHDLFKGRTTRRLTYGFSFSGGIALMAEALCGASDLLVVASQRLDGPSGGISL